MKKVLVTLLVLAVAMSSVFATVNMSGELVAGYAFQYYNGDGATSESRGERVNGNWYNMVMGQDGEDTNTTKLNVTVGDDSGLWSATLKGNLYADDRLGGSIKVDMAQLIAGEDTAISANLGLSYGRVTALRAYSMQKDFDRMRTADTVLWASLNLGYAFDGGSVELQVAGSPALIGVNGEIAENGDLLGANEGDVTVSALAKWNGIAASFGWILKGDADDSSMSNSAYNNYGEGLIGGAVDVNLGQLLGTDFQFGVAASDKYSFGGDINMFAVAAYFGFDPAKVTVQYGLTSAATTGHFLYAGVDVTAIENLALNVYGGAYDLSTPADTWYVGAKAGYTVSSVTFQLGLEYAAGKSYSYDDSATGAGLWIVPSIKVAF